MRVQLRARAAILAIALATLPSSPALEKVHDEMNASQADAFVGAAAGPSPEGPADSFNVNLDGTWLSINLPLHGANGASSPPEEDDVVDAADKVCTRFPLSGKTYLQGMRNCVVTLVGKHCQAVLKTRAKQLGNAPLAPFCDEYFVFNTNIGGRFWPVSWHSGELRHTQTHEAKVEAVGPTGRPEADARTGWDFERFTLKWCEPMYDQMLEEAAKEATTTNVGHVRNRTQFVAECQHHVEKEVVRTIFARDLEIESMSIDRERAAHGDSASDVDGLSQALKFIVLSAQRSGSNWLSQRLQMSPEVTMVGEDPRLIQMEGKGTNVSWTSFREVLDDLFAPLSFIESVGPSNSHAAPRKRRGEFALVKAAGAVIKYSHVPAHLRSAFVEYLRSRRIGVIHLLRHSQLEVYLSWQDNLSRRKNPARPMTQHVIDPGEFQEFRYTTYADSSYFRQALTSESSAAPRYHEVAYESLASPVVGGAVWMALLNFLEVEVRPPVDTPVQGSAVRRPCATRILNWRDLVNPPTLEASHHSATMAASFAADFRTSQLVALCATDVGQANVGEKGYLEARRHVTTMHQHSPSCKAQLGARAAVPSGANFAWLFHRYLRYPLIKGGVALRITSQWTGADTEQLPFSTEVRWLRDCLNFAIETHRSVEEAAHRLLANADVVAKPIALILLDWDSAAVRASVDYPPPRPLETPVPVRLVWVSADANMAREPVQRSGPTAEFVRSQIEQELRNRLSFMGIEWEAVSDLDSSTGLAAATGGGSHQMLLHDRDFYASVCRYGEKKVPGSQRHRLVPEGPLPCGW